MTSKKLDRYQRRLWLVQPTDKLDKEFPSLPWWKHGLVWLCAGAFVLGVVGFALAVMQ